MVAGETTFGEATFTDALMEVYWNERFANQAPSSDRRNRVGEPAPAAFYLHGATVGAFNNRLQACTNLLHLLGGDASLSSAARVLVTQLQSELAMFHRLLRKTVDQASPGELSASNR